MKNTGVRWRLPLGGQSVLSQASWVGLRLMIGYRALEAGADPWFLAVLTSTYAVPALLAAVPAGRLTDRVGGSAVAAAGTVVVTAGIGLILVFPGLSVLLVGSAIVGLGNLLAMVGQQTFVAHVHHGGPTDSGFGYLSATASAGQMLGPPIVTLAASLGQEAGVSPNTDMGLAACAFFSLVAGPLFWWLRPIDRGLAPARGARTAVKGARWQPVDPRVWRAVAISGFVLVTLDLLYTFVPLWAMENGVGATAVGFLLALRAAVSMVSRIGLGRLVNRFGRGPLLVFSISAAAAALAALPLVGMAGAIAVMLVLGVGLGVPQPLTMSWAVALTESSRHGMVLGLRLSANRLAQIVVPLGIGAVATPFGTSGVFWANSTLLAGCAALALKGHERGPGTSPRNVP